MARVLIVDNDPDHLAAVTYQLRRQFDRSIIIDTANYAVLAVLLAQTHGYDAILLKLFLPERLRLPFLGQLRRLQLQAHIVVIGGVNPQKDSVEAGHLDGVRWMSHPLDFGQLWTVMASLYHTRSVRHQAKKRRRSNGITFYRSLPF